MIREAQRLQQEGRVPEAIVAYQRLLTRWPDLPDCWFNLAVLQRIARQLTDALDSYQRSLDLGVRQPEEAHLNRGVIYSDYLRQDAAAERELLAALALNPTYVPALLNLANLNEDLGRREDARKLYERILALAPNAFEALARYANLHPLPLPEDGLINRLRAALSHPSATTTDRASLGFALGRLLDGCGDYEAAFAAYTQANRCSRDSAAPRIMRYDRRQQELLVQRLQVSTAVQASAPERAGPHPIFICGMFRSGSTLTEQLLMAHPGVAGGGELDFLPRLVARELAPFPESMAALLPTRAAHLASRYLDELVRLFPAAQYVTDKRPDNFLYIGLIKSLFPEAKIIHTTRDPLDTCLSIFFLHLDHSMSYALDLEDIGHYYQQYHRLMAHWKRLFGADILDFPYDTFVREPERTGAMLFDFLGLPWDDRYLARPAQGRAVKTASVWQAREPLYQRSSGRSRHYAGQLTALREQLGELASG
jgi:tetratricopeptide (TPR) repeat protein